MRSLASALSRAAAVGEINRSLRQFLLVQGYFILTIVGFSSSNKALVMAASMLVPLALILKGSRKACLQVFYFACVCFVVGQRTLWLSAHIRLVPSEILIWVLAVVCLRIKAPAGNMGSSKLPVPLFLLGMGAASGVVMTYVGGGNPDIAVAYAKELILLFPVFFVCGRLLSQDEQVHWVISLLVIECFFLSIFSLLEFFDLIPAFLSGYFQHVEYMGEGGFKRAFSSFWGGPMLAAYIAFCFPLLLSQLFLSRSDLQRLLSASSVAVSALAIYFSGHRGIWVPCLLGCAHLFFRKGAGRGAVFMAVLAVGLQFAPEEARNRFSGISAEKMDASTRIRKERSQTAWALVKESPILGNGWGSSGLVHNDWLQIWADAGLLPVIALALLFLKTWRRLAGFVRNSADAVRRQYAYGFQSSLICIILIMACQPFFHLPEQYPPLWTLVALAYWYSAVPTHGQAGAALPASMPQRQHA